MYWAQDEDFLPKLVPPSPQATELGRYGNVPVGMFTGSPNVNLNIYTLQESGLSIPINITYSSNGVQVDGVAKQLGIDWNLIAGGVITRQVNDMDDLQYPFYNVDTSNLACAASNQVASDIGSGNTIDTEKDIFSFNFLGNSGKFYLEGDNIVQINPSNIKIEKFTALNNTTPKFKITNIDGTEYYFGGGDSVEKSWNRSTCGTATPAVLDDTAWYLTKIKTVQGQEATFNYVTENFQYIQSYYQTAVTTKTGVSIPYATITDPCFNQLRHETALLNEVIINDKKIKFNYQKLEEINSYRSKQLVSMEVYNTPSNILKKYNFNYDAFTLPATYSMWRNSYTNADEKRIFLKNVQEVIPSTNEQTTRYAFDYYSPELIPPRHSFAKDIWGYFNGAHNLNIVYNNLINNSTPYNTDEIYNAFDNVHSERLPNGTYTLNGMLKNIYYPTKGRTEFIYEANSVSKDKLITPGNVGIASYAVSETVGYNSIHYSHTFIVQQNATVTFSLVAWRDCGVDDPVHPPQALAYIINADTGATVKSLFANETPAQTTASLVTGVNYKIKFKISRPCLGANANIVGPAAPPYTIKINDPVGGVRVSKTLDYDNNGNVETKRYFYGTLNKPDISSGILSTIDPSYQRNIDLFRKIVTGQGGATSYITTYTMFSNVKTSLFSLDGYSIMYPSVIESYGENFEKGGTLHQFYANQEETPIPICEDLIRGVAFSNSFLTGNKLASYNLRKNGNNFITVSSEEYDYIHNEVFDKSVDNYIARLKLIENTGFYSPFYGVNKYQLRSQFHYLSSKKNTIYDKDGLNPVKTQTEYFYNNPSHFQLSSQKSTSSDSSIEEKSFQYAHEKGNTKLINANMIGKHL